MQWMISHVPENNIILITSTGEISVKQFKQILHEALVLGQHHNSDLYLVDHRNVHTSIGVLDVLDLIKHMDEMDFPKRSRIAKVITKDDSDICRFLETVSLNRGFQLRIFDYIEAAKTWLTTKKLPLISFST